MDFPFTLLPGEHESTGEARYRIRTFLDQSTDGWWNVNMSESRLDIAAIMKTFEPESIQKGLARVQQLVEDAFQQLQFALPKFLATIPPRSS